MQPILQSQIAFTYLTSTTSLHTLIQCVVSTFKVGLRSTNKRRRRRRTSAAHCSMMSDCCICVEPHGVDASVDVTVSKGEKYEF